MLFLHASVTVIIICKTLIFVTIQSDDLSALIGLKRSKVNLWLARNANEQRPEIP